MLKPIKKITILTTTLFMLCGLFVKNCIAQKVITLNTLQLGDVAVCNLDTKKWQKTNISYALQNIQNGANNKIYIMLFGYVGSGAYSNYLHLNLIAKDAPEDISTSGTIGKAGDATEFIYNDRLFSYSHSGYFSEFLCNNDIEKGITDQNTVSIDKSELQTIFNNVPILTLSTKDSKRHISVNSNKFILVNDLENDEYCCYKYSLNVNTDSFPIIEAGDKTQLIYGKLGQDTDGAIYIDIKQ